MSSEENIIYEPQEYSIENNLGKVDIVQDPEYNNDSGPEAVDIESIEELLNYVKEYREVYANQKKNETIVNREDLVENTKKPRDIDNIQIIDTNDTDIPDIWKGHKEHLENKNNREIIDMYDLIKTSMEDEANHLENIDHIVYIPNELAMKIKNDEVNKIPEMADEDIRDDDERFTGLASELAFDKLANYIMDNHSFYNIESLKDDTEKNHYVGDYLINDYIMELKASKTTSSKQNITHRYHGQRSTPLMFIKNGIIPEMYVHSYVKDNTGFGYGVFVAFAGMTPVLPRHNGVYGAEQEVISTGWSYFTVTDVTKLDWYQLTGLGWNQIKNKLQKIKINDELGN